MSTRLRVALAQINATVGDLSGNVARIREGFLRAAAWRADLVVVPELAVTGYPPEDLLLKPRFIEDNLSALRRLVPPRDLIALVGCVDRDRRGTLSNAAALFAGGRHVATYHKQCLPNYGVFDEQRYFAAGTEALVLVIHGMRIGVTICEDLWEEAPCARLAAAGCRFVVNLSASPYHAGKVRERRRLFARRARVHRVAIAYCNLVGGQDELVFDGASLILSAAGRVVASGPQFQEGIVVADLPFEISRRHVVTAHPAGSVRTMPIRWTPRARPPLHPQLHPALGPLEEIYEALVLGTRDYVRKNGFATVVLGLSGGIDSSLTACIAVDAVGPSQVVGVLMPSRFSSPATQDDARALAQALGIRSEVLSIEPCFKAYLATLAPQFGHRPRDPSTRAPALVGGPLLGVIPSERSESRDDVTEQNLQARIRGTLLMALSNKFGWLVLTTGNKSEIATGYTTLYGDMAGGFAVIKDVPKTLVYRLARFRNRRGLKAPIPERVFVRAPTAELAPNQTDQDTLPPYDFLDRILKAYVEEDRSLRELLGSHRFAPETARRVVRLVDRAEYKRRQGPPGIKITPKAFGKDRRMPITNRYQQS